MVRYEIRSVRAKQIWKYDALIINKQTNLTDRGETQKEREREKEVNLKLEAILGAISKEAQRISKTFHLNYEVIENKRKLTIKTDDAFETVRYSKCVKM